MGGLGKLSDFGKPVPSKVATQDQSVETGPLPPQPGPNQSPSVTPKLQSKPLEQFSTINIKIKREQHQWLSETARQVRDNNLEPVPPSERVYPQHLIGVAIELMKSRKLDWSKIKTVEDLQKQLRL